jgi:hypothetical protein
MFLDVGLAMSFLTVFISSPAPGVPVISYQVRETIYNRANAATDKLLLSRGPLHFGLLHFLAWLAISQKFKNLLRRRSED